MKGASSTKEALVHLFHGKYSKLSSGHVTRGKKSCLGRLNCTSNGICPKGLFLNKMWPLPVEILAMVPETFSCVLLLETCPTNFTVTLV